MNFHITILLYFESTNKSYKCNSTLFTSKTTIKTRLLLNYENTMTYKNRQLIYTKPTRVKSICIIL